jgi:hypothetical protein
MESFWVFVKCVRVVAGIFRRYLARVFTGPGAVDKQLLHKDAQGKVPFRFRLIYTVWDATGWPKEMTRYVTCDKKTFTLSCRTTLFSVPFNDIVNCWDYTQLVIHEGMRMKYWWNVTDRGKTDVLEEKPVPEPRCPSQLSHGLAWDWTRVSAVRRCQLTAWFTGHIFGNSGDLVLCTTKLEQ